MTVSQAVSNNVWRCKIKTKSSFWASGTKRATASGISATSSFSFGCSKSEDDATFLKNTLPRLRLQALLADEREKFARVFDWKDRDFYYAVNDALNDVYDGYVGYLFSKEQVAEFVRHNPDVNVRLRDGVFVMESK